jgi:hypothetical protein
MCIANKIYVSNKNPDHSDSRGAFILASKVMKTKLFQVVRDPEQNSKNQSHLISSVLP